MEICREACRLRGKSASISPLGEWTRNELTVICRCLGAGILCHFLGGGENLVLCDESGLTEFPFSYIAHVTLLTPAQVRLRSGSGFAQACSACSA